MISVSEVDKREETERRRIPTVVKNTAVIRSMHMCTLWWHRFCARIVTQAAAVYRFHTGGARLKI